nr:hypothetical protein [Tanacetum cinerariifolium]
GEGLTVPVESHHTPSGAPKTSQPPLSSPFRIPTKQKAEVPQPSSPTHTHVADKATSTGVDVRHGRATTTITSLDTRQGSDKATSIGVDVRHGRATTTITSLDTRQGSGNIDKTSSMPYDSPLLRVYTLRSDKVRMKQNELMDLVTKLTDRFLALEIDLQQTKKVYSIAFTKLIMKGEGLTVPVESHHTPPGAPKTSQPPLSSPFRIPTKQKAEVPQPSSSTHTHVADKATSIGVDVRHGRATTTITSLDTRQGSGLQHKLLPLELSSSFVVNHIMSYYHLLFLLVLRNCSINITLHWSKSVYPFYCYFNKILDLIKGKSL